MQFLRRVTRSAWLKQPPGDFSIFREHPARDARWYTSQPPQFCYDKNAMYLGAAASVKLGVGPFTHVEAPEFSDQAGLWHIVLADPPPEEANVPPIIPTGPSWQYAPVLRYLHKYGYPFTVLEAYLFSEQHAVLRSFYEGVKTLRAQDKQAAKDIYTRTFGILAHLPDEPWPGMIYRPDWFFTLVAEAKVRMYEHLRQFYQADGAYPVAIKTDSLYYTQAMPSIPLGTNIGQFKLRPVEEPE
jgi:hypothetical protein